MSRGRRSTSVGRSWRSPAKHDFMDAFIREEVDATSLQWVKPGVPVRRYVWLDLTAGDAALLPGCEWHRACSPGLLSCHALFAPVPVRIRLLEERGETFGALIKNLTDQLPRIGYLKTGETHWEAQGGWVHVSAANRDGHDFSSARSLRSGDAVLSFNDPNSVATWATRASFDRDIGRMAVRHRSVTTMGFNVGGLGRLPRATRESWRGHIERRVLSLQECQDICIARVVNDGSKWSYLITTHNRPQSRFRANQYLKAAFEKVDRELDVAWWRLQPERFQSIVDGLVLTAAESVA